MASASELAACVPAVLNRSRSSHPGRADIRARQGGRCQAAAAVDQRNADPDWCGRQASTAGPEGSCRGHRPSHGEAPRTRGSGRPLKVAPEVRCIIQLLARRGCREPVPAGGNTKAASAVPTRSMPPGSIDDVGEGLNDPFSRGASGTGRTSECEASDRAIVVACRKRAWRA